MRLRPAIVIPAWNAERLLEATVQSVTAQTATAFKLVIVDDGSSDGTQELAHRLAQNDRRISVVSRPNGGLSAARNSGFEVLAEQSDCFLFVDADDVLESDALERLTRTLEAAPARAVGAYGLPRDMTFEGDVADILLQEAWGYRRRAVQGIGLRELGEGEASGFGTFVIWPAIETAGQALIRTSALRRAGPWRTMPGEDWDMWLRLTAEGEFMFLPEFTLRKRETPNSLSSNGKWLARAEPMIRASLASDVYSTEQRRIARMGDFHSVLVKFSWATSALGKREPVFAARQAYRAARGLAAFMGRALKY